jgi:LmbE family N-acetylglucosaminyl deacetylase
MNLRNIFRKAAGSALLGKSAGITKPQEAWAVRADIGDVVIERDMPGKPHKGKVLAVVHAHLDDVTDYASGTVAKLINEGYTAYLIRTSNNEKTGGGTTGQNIVSHERDHLRMAKELGFSDVFEFYYRQHRMNSISPIEIRGRLIYLFRYFKVDTVMTFNPWGHGEENPDHWVTGRAVEEACWMAGASNDFPEHFEAGVKPHSVRERYYWVSRLGQPFNRVVDVSSTLEQKIRAITECKSQGGGNWGSRLKRQLAKEGKRLPLLGNNDETADREYVRLLIENKMLSHPDDWRGDAFGFDGVEQYGLKYAERFYYIDQRPKGTSRLQDYIEKNTVTL